RTSTPASHRLFGLTLVGGILTGFLATAEAQTDTTSTSPTLRIDAEPTPCPLAVPCSATPEESPFGYDGGLYLRTKDRKYSLVVNGFAQLLYVLNKTEGVDQINQGFYLGLGRLALSGNVFSPKFNYFFQF